MSRRHKHRRRRQPPAAATPAPRRHLPGPAAVALALAVLAGLGFWWWKNRPANGRVPASRPVAELAALPFSSPTATGAIHTAATTAEAKPDIQALPGRWLRPDGGYVLEIRGADERGQLDAAYFNPNPIHVARAEATREGTRTKVFVELRDVNYPGSTYTLTYDPATDRLAGVYFQALLRESFDVVFVRQP